MSLTNDPRDTALVWSWILLNVTQPARRDRFAELDICPGATRLVAETHVLAKPRRRAGQPEHPVVDSSAVGASLECRLSRGVVRGGGCQHQQHNSDGTHDGLHSAQNFRNRFSKSERGATKASLRMASPMLPGL